MAPERRVPLVALSPAFRPALAHTRAAHTRALHLGPAVLHQALQRGGLESHVFVAQFPQREPDVAVPARPRQRHPARQRRHPVPPRQQLPVRVLAAAAFAFVGGQGAAWWMCRLRSPAGSGSGGGLGISRVEVEALGACGGCRHAQQDGGHSGCPGLSILSTAAVLHVSVLLAAGLFPCALQQIQTLCRKVEGAGAALRDVMTRASPADEALSQEIG